MRSTRIFASDRLLFAVIVVLLMGWSISPAHVLAQSQGNNAVYSGPNTVRGSSAFIDASVLHLSLGGGVFSDICARINAALVSLPSTTFGAVIDARGISGSDLTCSAGNTPWVYTFGSSQSTSTHPSTILLPAGTISVNNSWGMPNGTRLIGEGPGGPGTGVTTLQAASGSSFTWMIQMGGVALCSNPCIGVSVEDLALDGNNASSGISGILNGQSQELSYVQHVRFYNLSGVGLEVQNHAQNSGPYSDLSFSTSSAQMNTKCVSIQVSTRGIHGLTCTGNTGTGTIPSAGILLDGDNNSIEDVQVQGFQDGILVGSNASAQSNVLLNISGGTNVTNVVHIANVSGNTVSDLSIMGVGNMSTASVKTIQDDLTGTTISDATVGMYVLGEPVSVGTAHPGYSRFTTSPSAANWGVGGAAPATGTGATCTTGSLFTNTSGTTANTTLFVCANGQWQPE